MVSPIYTGGPAIRICWRPIAAVSVEAVSAASVEPIYACIGIRSMSFCNFISQKSNPTRNHRVTKTPKAGFVMLSGVPPQNRPPNPSQRPHLPPNQDQFMQRAIPLCPSRPLTARRDQAFNANLSRTLCNRCAGKALICSLIRTTGNLATRTTEQRDETDL